MSVSTFAQHDAPSTWKRTKMRHIFSFRREVTTEELPLLGVNLSLGVMERYEGDGRPAASDDLSKYKLVEVGDIIMNALGKPHGSIGRSSVRGITSPAYWVLRANEKVAYSRYMHYVLRSSVAISEYQRRGKNLPPNQFDLPWDSFRDIEVPLPSLTQQLEIIKYLDREVDRVEAALERVKRLEQLVKGPLATLAILGDIDPRTNVRN